MPKKLTTEEFIDKSRKIYGNKYDYSKVVYISSRNKIEIICPIHGSFYQTPNNHLRNRGCFKCSKIKKLTQQEFIDRAKIVHNGFYNYSKVNYINHKNKVIIICPVHGDFLQNTNHHLRGNGCNKCSSYISKPEIEFLNYLKIPDTVESRQVKILGRNIDGFNKNTNTVYEFLGDYYHGNPSVYKCHDYNPTCNKTFGELYKNTIKKLTILKKHYTVKYIWESDWKRFKSGIDTIPNIVEF